MKRSTERILTTHTGSLPRPKEIERLVSLADAGELSGVEAEQLPGAVAHPASTAPDRSVPPHTASAQAE